MGTGIASHYFNLEVIVPTARILGTEEYHVGKGSTINLICVIENVSFQIVTVEIFFYIALKYDV